MFLKSISRSKISFLDFFNRFDQTTNKKLKYFFVGQEVEVARTDIAMLATTVCYTVCRPYIVGYNGEKACVSLSPAFNSTTFVFADRPLSQTQS